MREFGAVGEHELDCCTCVTEGKPSWGVLFRSCGPCLSDMGRFEIFMGRFGFGHGAFCRRTGRGSVPAARFAAARATRTLPLP